jgi:hypothetical protein
MLSIIIEKEDFEVKFIVFRKKKSLRLNLSGMWAGEPH